MESNNPFTDFLKHTNDIIDTVEDASKPSRPETDNHETGFWKGLAFGLGIALAVALVRKNE